MNIIVTRLLISAALLLATVITGVWLSRLGRPLNGLLFNVHKLIALGNLVLLGFVANQMRGSAAGPLVWLAIGLTALFFLALFVSGALLSIRQTINWPMRWLHRAAPLLSVITTGAAIMLLAGGLTAR